MVICRPECMPLGSPPQPSTQPPSPMMMLGPDPSAETAEFEPPVLRDLPPQPRKYAQAITSSRIAIPSFTLSEPSHGMLPDSDVPKLGTLSFLLWSSFL